MLPASTYDFLAGGADDELTLNDSRAAWSRLRLWPRVLRDVATVDTTTTVLGSPVAAPILVAPIGYQRLVRPEGEAATASGTARAGTLMVVPTRSSVAIERWPPPSLRRRGGSRSTCCVTAPARPTWWRRRPRQAAGRSS